MEHFWNRWRKEYLIELRESHRRSHRVDADIVSVGDVVIVHDDTPRGLWRLGIIERLIKGRDSQVRGAVVRVKPGQSPSSFLRRPVQRLFPLEVRQSERSENLDHSNETGSFSDQQEPHTERNQDISNSAGVVDLPEETDNSHLDDTSRVMRCPQRRAATEARDKIVARLLD